MNSVFQCFEKKIIFYLKKKYFPLNFGLQPGNARKSSQCEPTEESSEAVHQPPPTLTPPKEYPNFQTEVSNTRGVRKRVNFKLNHHDECIEEEFHVQQAVATRKVYRKTRSKKIAKVNRADMKNVIFNGTFPIDCPLQSRFETGESDGGEECEPLKTMSMRELVADRNVKFNLTKMREEFHESLTEFERFLAKGSPSKFVNTYAVDEPM